MTDKDFLKMLGLDDKTISLTLEDDIMNTMGKFVKDKQEHEQEKREFISMFKECFEDIIKIIALDGRIAVECFTCIKGMDLSKQYGRPRKHE